MSAGNSGAAAPAQPHVFTQGRLLALTAAVLLAVGCHHDTGPTVIEPAQPPLPPASGTPIGFLVDDADELKLTSDQVTRLKQIDEDLAGRLEAIDGDMRAAHRPVEPDGASPSPGGGMQGGGRRGHGGMRGGGMRGGMGGGGMGGPGMGHGGRGRGGGGPGQAHGAGGPSGSGDARLAQRRDDEVRDAFARAFTIMDATQQDAAKKLLVAHDIDIDRIESPSPVESGADTPPADSAVPPSE